jgi:hypothetical protein
MDMYNKFPKYISVVFAVLLLLLVVSADFHHNHPATVAASANCSVFLFQSTIATGLILLFLFLVLVDLKSQVTYPLYSVSIPRFLPYSKPADRAPPLA